ncbi:MAG: ABC transporter substrate-binding protein [Actinomycetota bacterium]
MRTFWRRRMLAVVVAAALVAAACGDSDDGSDTAAEDASASESADNTGSEPVEEAGDSAAEDETTEAEDAGGAEDAADYYPLTISDSFGTEYTFEEEPRIGCAWYGCVEAAAELGVSFAASIISEEETTSAFYGRTAPEFLVTDMTNPEEWAAADVDIVLFSPASNSPDFDPVSQVVDTFFLHYDNFLAPQWDGVIGGYEGYIENLRLIGTMMNREAEAEAAIARFNTMVENLAVYATDETAEQTIAIIGLLGYASLGPGSAMCQVLNEAGHGTCIGSGVAEVLNAEAFLAIDPSLIIDVDPAAREGDPIWPNLSAVQNDNVYNFLTNRYYCCSTAGLIVALQEYVHRVFPDSGVPAPGPDADFDPTTSPLVQG